MSHSTATIEQRGASPSHGYPYADVTWELGEELTVTVKRSWSIRVGDMIPADIAGAHAWNKLDYLEGQRWLGEDVNPWCAEIVALTEHMGPALCEKALEALAAALVVVRIADEDDRRSRNPQPLTEGELADARNMGWPV